MSLRAGDKDNAAILAKVADYYTDRLQQHGPVPRGVDWNSLDSQETRFAQLLRVCDRDARFSLNDFGCGYGALADYLRTRRIACSYRGFDVSEAMISEARTRHRSDDTLQWVTDESELVRADYTVASGVLNVRLDVSEEDWERHTLQVVDALAARSKRGFAFNVLTKYSDADRRRRDLYYADPCMLFDHCQRRYSRWVSVLHDYGLYEFTILVRLDGGTPWRG